MVIIYRLYDKTAKIIKM